MLNSTYSVTSPTFRDERERRNHQKMYTFGTRNTNVPETSHSYKAFTYTHDQKPRNLPTRYQHHLHEENVRRTIASPPNSRTIAPPAKPSSISRPPPKSIGFARFLFVVCLIVTVLCGFALAGWSILCLIADEGRSWIFGLFFGTLGNSDRVVMAYSWIPIASLGLGFFVLGTGLIGLAGHSKSSKILLGVYYTFLATLCVCLLAVGIGAKYAQTKMVPFAKTEMSAVLEDQYALKPFITQGIDYLQAKMSCCGISGHEEYLTSRWKQDGISGNSAVAQTCCVLKNDNDPLSAATNPKPVNRTACDQDSNTKPHMYRFERGCRNDLVRFVEYDAMYIAKVHCAAAFIAIFLFITSLCALKEI